MENQFSPAPQQAPLQPIRVNNRSAVAAGICGIASIAAQVLGLGLAGGDQSIASLCSGIGGLAWIAGIVLGILGLVQIRRHPDQKGTGWALAGIGLGLLRVCIVTILLLIAPSVAALPR
jgi:hypothetical protein